MRASKSELPVVQLRMAAGAMLERGESVADVCKIVGISRSTVIRYQRVLRVGGLTALGKMGTTGRPSALSQDAIKWYRSVVLDQPKAHGFRGDRWTPRALGEVIARELGIVFSRVHVRQITIDFGLGHRLKQREPVAE